MKRGALILIALSIIFLGCAQQEETKPTISPTSATTGLDLANLTNEEVISYALKDKNFSKMYSDWKLEFGHASMSERDGKQMLYVKLWAYRGDWQTVNEVWFFLSRSGEIKDLRTNSAVKDTFQPTPLSTKEREEMLSIALNDSKVKEAIAGRDFEIKSTKKFMNRFTGEESNQDRQIYIKINNSTETYLILLNNNEVAVKNTTCPAGRVGWCFLGDTSLDLANLTSEEVIGFALRDDEFGEKYRHWEFNVTEKRLVERDSKEMLYVDLWAHKGEWEHVIQVWFYLNEDGELVDQHVYPYIKTTHPRGVSPQEREEMLSLALNDSEVREVIAGKDYNVSRMVKFVNPFTDEEKYKEMYVKINNSPLSYVITIKENIVSIENTTCPSGEGFCYGAGPSIR